MNTKVSAKICMFRLNELGDCFLITFTAGKSSSRLLIDCGSFRNTGPSIQRIKQIVGELGKKLDKKPLDVVVGTHQHNDHLSGFVHCEKPFEKLKVQEVWLSWLDDPTDRKAREIGKAHHNLRLQLAAVRDILQPMVKGKTKTRPTAARAFEVLDDMLGFDGAAAEGPPDVPARGVKILKSIGQKKSEPEYLRPGRTLQMPGLPSGTVQVHVLGPPRVEGVERKNDPLYRIDPKKNDLLKRTVFYKVGHHASHNATLVEVFEKMNSPDLVALIPVHKQDPNITKANGWRMPAKNLFNRLKEKTSHRVLQMDNENPPDCDPAKSPAKESWKKVGITPTITNNTIEIEIDG